MYVVKIGGSVLTDKTRPFSYREKIANEIARVLKGFKGILVHGVGSYGHPLAIKYRLWEGLRENTIEWADTRLHVLKLHMRFLEALISNGIPAVTFGPANMVSYGLWNKKPLEEFLKHGFVPVLFGDGILDKELGLKVISGDDIVAELSMIFREEIDAVVFCVDVDGIFTDDPKKNPNAKLIKEISRENLLKFARSSEDFSGAMKKKAESIMRIPEEIPVYIINGLKPENIKRVFKGENPGTLVRG